MVLTFISSFLFCDLGVVSHSVEGVTIFIEKIDEISERCLDMFAIERHALLTEVPEVVVEAAKDQHFVGPPSFSSLH